MGGSRGLLGLLAAALLFGLLSVIFTFVWILHYREGLGWDGTALQFNWHPLLAVIGFVFIQGLAIIVYRLPWTWKCSKLLMKSIHAGLNTVAAILAIVSLVAVFENRRARNLTNMYSLHSWIGLTAVILYVLQLVLGFCIFLLPWAPLSLRAIAMPIHVYSGLFLFGTVIATVLMGVTEKLTSPTTTPPYNSFSPEGIFTNTLSLLIVLYGALIFWIATRPQWKRPKESDSSILQSKGGAGEEVEGTITMSLGDKSEAELNNEVAARKRNFGLDEASQRSTM